MREIESIIGVQWNREIPTRGSTVPVGNEASKMFMEHIGFVLSGVGSGICMLRFHLVKNYSRYNHGII